VILDAPIPLFVRRCASCGYLILGHVDECQNCGTDLGAAVVGAAPAAATRFAGPTVAPPTAPPPSAPPPAYGTTAPAPPVHPQRDMFGPTTWAPAPVITTKRRAGNPRAAIAVVVVMFMASAAIGYTVLTHRNALPAGTSDFVNGKGITYTPADASYTVQFPTQPEVDSQSSRIGSYSVTTNMAIVTADNYELGTAEAVLPVNVPESKIDQVLNGGADASMSGIHASGVDIRSRMQLDGLPALEVRAKGPDGYSVREIVAVSSRYIFVLFVHAKTGTDRLYSALKSSFVANT
jgi:hypothetical protein